MGENIFTTFGFNSSNFRFQFNLMCVGETGIGKTTLIESLFNMKLEFDSCEQELNTVELRSKTYGLLFNCCFKDFEFRSRWGRHSSQNDDRRNGWIRWSIGQRQKVFSFRLIVFHLNFSAQVIVGHINEQFEKYFKEELKVSDLAKKLFNLL